MPYLRLRQKLKRITPGMRIIRHKKPRQIRNYYFGRYDKERGILYAVFDGPFLIEARDVKGRRIRRTKYAGMTKPINK